MKFLFKILVVFSICTINAQVGINTIEPKSSLDVVGNPTTTSSVDGLQAPRLTRLELTNKGAIYTAQQTGALIYITNVAGGNTTGPRVNITSAGYYYFDGSVWQQLINTNTDTDTNTNTNIYNSNGTTGANRAVNITNNLRFDGNTLYIDAASNEIGIKTTNPTRTLDVNGRMRVRDLPTTSATDVLTADAAGNIGKFNTFLVSEVDSEVAANPVNRTVSGTTIVNNINLGLATTVFVPANREALLIINYSVPVGVTTGSVPTGYYGIRFLKDGTEEQQGSRKFTVNGNTGPGIYRMSSVSNTYTENFTAVGFDRTITYTLNGYVEQYGGTHSYRFNMWQAAGANFNWGKATITKTVYLK